MKMRERDISMKKKNVDNFIWLDYWPIENGLLMSIAIFSVLLHLFWRTDKLSTESS